MRAKIVVLKETSKATFNNGLPQVKQAVQKPVVTR